MEEFNKNICVQTPDTFTAQRTVPGNTRIEETVLQIYVIDGEGGNLLSAKTAQDLALVDQPVDHHKHATQSRKQHKYTSMKRSKDTRNYKQV